MAKFFSSDLHHSHKRITEFTPRGQFTTPENHTDWLVEVINRQTTGADTLYHLGDFSFSRNYEDVLEFVQRLNCNLFLIKGNHCNREVMQRLRKECNKVVGFQDYKSIKLSNGQSAYMFHFPIRVWDRQHYGSYHLHGHLHGAQQLPGKILDVGIDNAYNIFGEHKLFSEEEVIEIMSKKEIVNDGYHD